MGNFFLAIWAVTVAGWQTPDSSDVVLFVGAPIGAAVLALTYAFVARLDRRPAAALTVALSIAGAAMIGLLPVSMMPYDFLFDRLLTYFHPAWIDFLLFSFLFAPPVAFAGFGAAVLVFKAMMPRTSKRGLFRAWLVGTVLLPIGVAWCNLMFDAMGPVCRPLWIPYKVSLFFMAVSVVVLVSLTYAIMANLLIAAIVKSGETDDEVREKFDQQGTPCDPDRECTAS
ncbi:MAG: hypothetical protein AB1696_04075 [Planctomycetota bacterium]